jgi:ATP synthase protein I
LQRHDVWIVRGAVLATLLAAPVAVLLGALAAGGRGALGAGLGIGLAAVFFSVTVLVVDAVGRVSPQLMMPAALGVYVVKLVVLLLGLLLLRGVTVFDRVAFGLAVVAGTCVYLVAEVRMALKARIPYVIVGDDGKTR